MAWIKIIGLLILSLNGVGFSGVYSLGLLLIYFSWAIQATQGKDLHRAGYVFLIACIVVFFPEFLQLSSISIAVALMLKDFKTAASLALISLLNAEAYWASSAALFLLGPIVVLLPFAIPTKYKALTANALFSAYILLNVLTIINTPGLTIPNDQDNAPPYQIGNVYSKLGLEAKSGGIAAIEGDQAIRRGDTTIYGEHDTFEVGGIKLGEQNYQQQSRWLGRQFLGPEMIRSALSMDGYHAANLGMQLKRQGRNVLSHQSSDGIHPLIIIYDGRLITGDSDAFVNRLAPYQRNLLSALSIGSPFGSPHALAFYFLLLLTIFARGTSLKEALLLLGIASLFIGNNFYLVSGDIRYVGKTTGWPHTERAYGIARYFQDNEKNYTFGNISTYILVIEKGNKGTIRDQEQLVITGSGSKIDSSDGVYHVGSIPLGTKNNVINAFGIYDHEGNLLGEGICSISIGDKPYTIIATDSPCLLPIYLLE